MKYGDDRLNHPWRWPIYVAALVIGSACGLAVTLGLRYMAGNHH